MNANHGVSLKGPQENGGANFPPRQPLNQGVGRDVPPWEGWWESIT